MLSKTWCASRNVCIPRVASCRLVAFYQRKGGNAWAVWLGGPGSCLWAASFACPIIGSSKAVFRFSIQPFSGRHCIICAAITCCAL